MAEAALVAISTHFLDLDHNPSAPNGDAAALQNEFDEWDDRMFSYERNADRAAAFQRQLEDQIRDLYNTQAALDKQVKDMKRMYERAATELERQNFWAESRFDMCTELEKRMCRVELRVDNRDCSD